MSVNAYDWAIIAGYVVVVLAIGYFVRRRVRDAGGYLLGNRKLGTPMMIASTFAGGITANQPVSVAANTYINGLSGMWLSLAFALATPFFWMWPPVLRRLRLVTMVDFFRQRYGRRMEMLKLMSVLVAAPFTFGAGIKAGALLLVEAGGLNAAGLPAIGVHTAIAMIVLPTLVYTLLGGVVAVYAVDMFQSVLIVILSFIVLPYVVLLLGGVGALGTRVHAINPDAWQLIGGVGGVPGVWLFWFAVSLFFSAPTVYGGGSGAARNEVAARFALLGSLGKRICTIGWGLTGVFALALLGAPGVSGVQAEHVFAKTCVVALPGGLRGVMMAAMLATVMSSLANMMLTFGGSVVNNLYKDYIVRGAQPAHYLQMARVFSALPIAMGWVVATSGVGLVHLAVITEQINSVLGVSIIAALVWRRVTSTGAFLATIAMAPLFYLGNRMPAAWPEWYRTLVDSIRAGYDAIGVATHIDPARIADLRPESLVQLTTPVYLAVGILVLVVVSLVTRQHQDKTVAEFYARAETPVGAEARLRAAGFQADTLEDMNRTKMDAAEKDRDVSRRLLLLDFFTWPWLVATRRAKLSDYWVDFAGISGSVACLAALFALLHWGVRLLSGPP